MWMASRVKHRPDGKLSATAAYQDYSAACNLNGLPAMTERKFYDLLTAKAENSGGRIGKTKIQGLIYYTGLAFAGEPEQITTVGADELAALPHRT